jgi:protein ImuA
MSEPAMTNVISFDRNRNRGDIVAQLQHLLRQKDTSVEAGVFSFGLPVLDGYLPHGGLSLGALHDIVPQAADDRPSAFGFLTALICCISQSGPVVIVSSLEDREAGRIYGHGLDTLGLDPRRVILIEAGDEIRAHWAIEEALKSKVPAAIAAAAEPDFKTSRRLHLAAGKAGLPLLLLRPAANGKSSAGATRWRIAAARAACDRHHLLKGWRWHVALERCRNGRPGEWLVEFDHDTHRFSLAAAVADPAFPQGAVAQSIPHRSG